MPLVNHPQHTRYFFAYALNYIFLGIAISALGPLIPYLADMYNRKEPEFSFLFFFRSMGMITGGVLNIFLDPHMSQIDRMIMGSLGTGVFLGLFGIAGDGDLADKAYIFLGYLFFIFNDILINVGIMAIYCEKDLEVRISSVHGMFGIGALLGPIVVWFLQEQSFVWIGFGTLILIPIYFNLVTPEKLTFPEILLPPAPETKVEILAKENNEKIEDFFPTVFYPAAAKQGYYVSFLLFLYVGLECSHGGWISSYAVMNGVATKESAALFPTLFYFFLSTFRFILPHYSMKPSKKLVILVATGLGVEALSLLLIKLGFIYAACIFSSVSLGICLSVQYPLILTMLKEYGFELSSQQTTNAFLFAALGEGILSMAIGYAMDFFGTDMLFFGMLLLHIVALYSISSSISLFQNNQKENQAKTQTLPS